MLNYFLAKYLWGISPFFRFTFLTSSVSFWWPYLITVFMISQDMKDIILPPVYRLDKVLYLCVPIYVRTVYKLDKIFNFSILFIYFFNLYFNRYYLDYNNYISTRIIIILKQYVVLSRKSLFLIIIVHNIMCNEILAKLLWISPMFLVLFYT